MSVTALIEITCEEKWVEEGFVLLDIIVSLLDSVMIESLDEMRMEHKLCYHKQTKQVECNVVYLIVSDRRLYTVELPN